MNATPIQPQENVFKRILWLYGLYSLLNMVSFLSGYYVLPEGFMRGSPYAAIGSFVDSATSFWGELSLTLFFNLSVVVVVCILTNLQQFRGIPIGYVVPIILGITSGLISGTNSFVSSDLKQFNAWDGMALGMSIGGVEMLAYVLVISATARIGLYNYGSLWQWQGEKIKNLRDIRLSVGLHDSVVSVRERNEQVLGRLELDFYLNQPDFGLKWPNLDDLVRHREHRHLKNLLLQFHHG